MKASSVIKELIDKIAEYGDKDLKIDLLTENQSNIVNITGFYFNEKDNLITIDCDINDVDGFKNKFK